MKRKMKKIVSLLIILLLVVGCGNNKKEDFYLNYNGKDMKLDMAFSVNNYGKYKDSFESENCAFGDRDVTYIYDDIEVETYGKNNELYVYSIRFTSQDVKTNEKIGLYDSMTEAIKVYGNDYEKNDNKYTYRHNKTSLIFIANNDIIESIEYRLDNID